jgi:hypothetical protein
LRHDLPRAPASLALGFFVATLASTARAYRPFDGTDGDVAEYKTIELELAPLGYLRSQHQSALIAPAAIFNLGFLPRWELVIQGTGAFGASSPPSFIDGGIFVKHVLREGVLQQKSGFSLASEVGVLLPTAGVPGVAEAGPYIGFIASYGWRAFLFHFNVSIARNTDAQPDLFVGTILEGVPESRIRPVAELYVDRHGSATTPSVLVGFIMRAVKHLDLDAATRLAWFLNAPLFEVRAGLTWTIPL